MAEYVGTHRGNPSLGSSKGTRAVPQGNVYSSGPSLSSPSHRMNQSAPPGRSANFTHGATSSESSNQMSLRAAQTFLTTPNDVFHSSISGGMPGWDTSRAGMPVY